MSGKNVWTTYQEQDITALTAMAEGYKAYISEGKTERECVNLARAEAENRGFVRLEEKIEKGEALKPGDKVYADCMGKAMLLAVIGQEPMEKGMNILGAHIDSPRLDLKQNPLYEDTEMALLDTHYYGGIKKYQWVTLPLAIHGVVAKKDGTMISINVGEGENDPVFCISDLLVHLSAEQMEKKAKEVIEGEGLNVLIGSQPLAEEEKDGVKLQILKLLKDSYDMEEEDFLSAELEIVPAGKARDCGLDRSMVIGYGQDDRICAYTSLLAILEVENLSRTGICLLVDKEEIGSVGATGMHSHFFEDTVAEIMNLTGAYSELALRRALRNSCMLSSDVSAAFDPNYASAFEKKNSAYFGKGLVFNKYTGSRGKSGSNDASAEYMAKIRRVMDEAHVAYQTAELGKVDLGGGGTIAYILANYGMEVIDSGIALLNMHAPWEISSKADIYEAYKGYCAFLKNMD
jgi:aspartyl aminopeptidase